MKVRELIARLQSEDPDMNVTTASAEFGLIELEHIEPVRASKIVPTKHNAAQYRLVASVDHLQQLTVLCLGPSDPSYVGELLNSAVAT